MGEHFADLHSLRLHQCSLPLGLLHGLAAVLPDRLNSLTLMNSDAGEHAVAELTALGALSSLTTLRLLPSRHALGGLEWTRRLRLRQLKVR